MKHLMITMIVALVAMAAMAEPQLTGTPSELTAYLSDRPKEAVSISGESEIKVQADRAYVRIKVVTEGKSFQDALNENAALRQEITDELKRSGIPETNISGTKFSFTPEQGIFSDKTKSYTIQNTVRVMVADESQFRSVAGAIDEHKEAEYGGVEFENSKESETKQEALASACKAVKQKKQLYEEQFGIKLILKTFSEGVVHKHMPIIEDRKLAYDSLKVANIKLSEYREGTETSISQFGEIIYRGAITVQYQITAEQ